MRIAACTLAAALASTAPSIAMGQTTDGFHAIQVVPVVVDTASFTQRFSFRNPGDSAVTLQVDYFPATGTAQALSLACKSVSVPAGGDATSPSLRDLCPGLASGSNFGTVVARTNNALMFSVYTRVSNAAGAGFSVEGFAAHTFTSAWSSVAGLRRLAATANSPAYQTNCFVGNLAEYTPTPAPSSVSVAVQLWRAGTQIGGAYVNVPPGQMVRLLDVFGAANLPAGDYDGVTAVFVPQNNWRAAMLAFCTVQDNTSFGADFRIAKTEKGLGTLVATQDAGLWRDVLFSGDLARQFMIPAGATRNIHAIHFRHPDVISCAIWDSGTHAAVAASYGLEVRLLSGVTGSPTWEAIAGGNNVTSFTDFYLGDKAERGGGLNTLYQLEIESNGQNEGVDRYYQLRCRSGSGHDVPTIIVSGAPVAF